MRAPNHPDPLLPPSVEALRSQAQLFKKLDPGVAYAKCPTLKALLDEMLALAQAAGLGPGQG